MLMTSPLQPQQPSTRDDFIVGNDLTSLLADDVQTVLKHLGSVREFCFHASNTILLLPTCSLLTDIYCGAFVRFR